MPEKTAPPRGGGGSPPRRQARAAAGTATAQAFERLGLRTPVDFIVHLPLRYEDETRITPIAEACPEQFGVFEGEVLVGAPARGARGEFRAVLWDGTARLHLRWIHAYPALKAQVRTGHRIRVRGDVRAGYHGPEIIHARVSDTETPLSDRLTPIYPTTRGLTQARLRKAIAHALDATPLEDTVPEAVRQRCGLPDLAASLQLLHRPPPGTAVDSLQQHTHPAWQRIKFDELLAQQIALAQARAARRRQRAVVLEPVPDTLSAQLLSSLPFEPTDAQRRVLAEIQADLDRAHPMHRLLQGDVGSGKTLVAVLAAARIVARGGQVAVMAPTEILAEQLWQKFHDWLTPLGVCVARLTGEHSQRADAKHTRAQIATGAVQVAVGTQALVQDKVSFARLALVINDEQHRFGVGQRLALARKGDGPEGQPHQLSMSATPIPRTLAMAFFADMDVSVIDALPAGRSPVRTRLFEAARRPEVLAHVAQAVRGGQQAYWVCPLVEESEALQLQTAVDTWHTLCAELPDLRIGLMHGRMASQEKSDTMTAFRAGALDVLVSTTVIEVGVDVPGANLMVIEHAERFGLAQLHQLRGRIGRGSGQATCVLLFQSPLTAVARERLRAMYETSDGFEIARRDLAQRGPGELLGLRQSGQVLLRFADLESDDALLVKAREAASHMLAAYPQCAQRHQERWLGGAAQYLRG